MFVNACEVAGNFTQPLVMSTRTIDGRVGTALGAFIVLNDKGWIATTAHGLVPLNQFTQDKPFVDDFDRQIAELEQTEPNAQRRAAKARRVKRDKNWLTNVSPWLGVDQAKLLEVKVFPELDLAVCRVENLDHENIAEYPRFRHPDDIKPGASVIRLGYPFHDIASTWDEQVKRFRLAQDLVPPPLFAIEGIFSRGIDAGATQGGVPIRLMETSSPGLKGQSGGPIVDRDGAVCAMQTATMHYELGFSPQVPSGGRTVVEHQFLNVGRGLHTSSLRAAFDALGVAVAWTR